MLTVEIGKSFLDAYNTRTQKEYRARDFFRDICAPLFFKTEAGYKHLLQVHNSPFFQDYGKKINESGLDEYSYRIDLLDQKLQYILNGVYLNKKMPEANAYPLLDFAKQELFLSGSVAPGFWAGGYSRSTSGQVSNIQNQYQIDDIYCAWIGVSLSIAMEGGVSILINNQDILWHIFNGWPYYREYIKDNNLNPFKGRQLDTWNSIWLTYLDLDDSYGADSLQKITREIKIWGLSDQTLDKKHRELIRPKWYQTLMALNKASQKLNIKEVEALMFNLGDTNESYGLIPIKLYEVSELFQYWSRLMMADSSESDAQNNRTGELLKTRFSLKDAAEMGGLGLRQLEPREAIALLGQKINIKSNIDAFDQLEELIKSNKKIFKFTYKWINEMAQLQLAPDNPKLLELATSIAKELKRYRLEGDKTTPGEKRNRIKKLLEQKNKVSFMQLLTPLMQDIAVNLGTINESYSDLIDSLAVINFDQFRLFKALLAAKFVFFTLVENKEDIDLEFDTSTDFDTEEQENEQ